MREFSLKDVYQSLRDEPLKIIDLKQHKHNVEFLLLEPVEFFMLPIRIKILETELQSDTAFSTHDLQERIKLMKQILSQPDFEFNLNSNNTLENVLSELEEELTEYVQEHKTHAFCFKHLKENSFNFTPASPEVAAKFFDKIQGQNENHPVELKLNFMSHHSTNLIRLGEGKGTLKEYFQTLAGANYDLAEKPTDMGRVMFRFKGKI